MADTELLPCPWCGETPDVSTDASFRLTDGVKYGALQCCVVGPEVRTDYKDLPHWRERAISAWNDRKALASRPPEVDDEGLPPLPEPFENWDPRYEGLVLPVFTAEQYRQGQRDAVAADRARRGGKP